MLNVLDDDSHFKGTRKIWERNLFNVKKEEAPAPEKEIPVENIALDRKDLGLKLMGTVLADDSSLSRASSKIKRRANRRPIAKGTRQRTFSGRWQKAAR